MIGALFHITYCFQEYLTLASMWRYAIFEINQVDWQIKAKLYLLDNRAMFPLSKPL